MQDVLTICAKIKHWTGVYEYLNYLSLWPKDQNVKRDPYSYTELRHKNIPGGGGGERKTTTTQQQQL